MLPVNVQSQSGNAQGKTQAGVFGVAPDAPLFLAITDRYLSATFDELFTLDTAAF